MVAWRGFSFSVVVDSDATTCPDDVLRVLTLQTSGDGGGGGARSGIVGALVSHGKAARLSALSGDINTRAAMLAARLAESFKILLSPVEVASESAAEAAMAIIEAYSSREKGAPRGGSSVIRARMFRLRVSTAAAAERLRGVDADDDDDDEDDDDEATTVDESLCV